MCKRRKIMIWKQFICWEKNKDVDWIYLLQKMIQNRHMALLYKLKNDRSLPF